MHISLQISCFHSRLSRKVDILIFNPPYVATPSEEVGRKQIQQLIAMHLHRYFVVVDVKTIRWAVEGLKPLGLEERMEER